LTDQPQTKTGASACADRRISLCGERAPVEVLLEMFYADAALAATARLDLPAEHEERAAWVAEGRIEVGGPARLILDGPRQVWWNFVSSSAARIEQAKVDWKAGRFGKCRATRPSSSPSVNYR
jgi:hypothetical protein